MDESTAIAIPDSGGAATAPVSESLSGAPAVETGPTSPGLDRSVEPGGYTTSLTDVRTASPPTLNKSGKTSDQEVERLASLVTDEIERQAEDPPPVAWDKSGNVTPEYSQWMQRQQTKTPAAKRTPRAPAVSAQFKALGYSSNDEAIQTLTTVRDLYEKPEGPGVALAEVEARSPEAFERVRNLVISSNPQLALRQAALLCGWDMDAEQQPSNDLPMDLARIIPPDLQPTAKTLSTDLLKSLAKNGAESLVYHLQQESQIREQWQEQTANFNEQWTKALTEAEESGKQAVAALIGQHETAHHAELSKWKPFGANAAANEAERRNAFAGALDLLLSDQKWLDVHNRMLGLLTLAPTGRLFGQRAEADQAEREARQLAQQFSTRLGQMIRDRVKLLDNAIRGAIAHAVEEALKNPAPLEPLTPSRELRPGEPPRLGKDGKTSDTWMDWMIKKTMGARIDSRPETVLPNGKPNPAYAEWFERNVESKRVLTTEGA